MKTFTPLQFVLFAATSVLGLAALMAAGLAFGLALAAALVLATLLLVAWMGMGLLLRTGRSGAAAKSNALKGVGGELFPSKESRP